MGLAKDGLTSMMVFIGKPNHMGLAKGGLTSMMVFIGKPNHITNVCFKA